MSEPNEIDEWGPTTKCSRCGEKKPCLMTSDPFSREVFPEDGPYEEAPWCEDCFDARADDI
jgi:hypothetical protein